MDPRSKTPLPRHPFHSCWNQNRFTRKPSDGGETKRDRFYTSQVRPGFSGSYEKLVIANANGFVYIAFPHQLLTIIGLR